MTDYERVEKVIRYLDGHYLEQPSLERLARVAGLSPFHFHRLFTRWAGATPKALLKFLTAGHAKALLADSRDLLSAAYDSGLSGPGRLHDLLVTTEAVSPGEFKARGQGVEIAHGFHPTPFGLCLIATTRRGVCHLAFVDTDRARAFRELKAEFPRATFKSNPRGTAAAVERAFAGRSVGNSGANRPPLSVLLRGTPFQLKVWEALLRIPAGHVLSYADVARSIGQPSAARAVGTAVGANSIAYLIPCHRVIRETGIIGRYRWGSPRKHAILARETARSGREHPGG